MKFHIIIFGCQMNYSDAARIKAILINSWHNFVTSISEADVVIIDTCSVRQKSEDKVTGKLKEIPADKKIRITWCMIQHNMKNSKISKALSGKKSTHTTWNFVGNVTTQKPTFVGRTNEDIKKLWPIAYLQKQKNATLKNFVYVNHAFNPMYFNFIQKHPNIELFFRIDDTWFLPLMMEHLWYEVNPDVEIINEYTWIIPHSNNQIFKENTKTAYVPISTGCSQFCAYCIVPYARGLEKNLDIEKIITETKHHLSNGVEEIVLLGQIVNKHPQFVDLCKQILTLPWLKWLRYTSPYPTYYSKELLDLHEQEPKMSPHIHMPLQSWSTAQLKKMFRGYTAEEFKTFIDNIRSLKREISITTDIIVWFCDESEEDFQKSMELAKYGEFDQIYIGIYSPRPGTIAYKKYEDNIPKETKKQRWALLNDLQIQNSITNNLKEHGKEREIIINKITDTEIWWYTDNMKNVIIKKRSIGSQVDLESIRLWEFLKVTINDSEAFTLHATLSE